MSAFNWKAQPSEIAADMKSRSFKGHGMPSLHTCTRSQPVEQLSLDGAPIRRYPSLTSAANDMGCTQGAIRAVITGRCKQSMGFKWRYVANFIDPKAGEAK